MPEDAYGALADDYHWLLSDTELRLGACTPGVRAVLSGLSPGSRVLDAACGIGVDAVALAHRGFEVTGADASPAMLEQTRARVDSEGCGHPIELLCSSWSELPLHLEPQSFDAVLCTGNSVAHLADDEETIATYRAFASLLVAGGALVIDTHDWDVVCSAGQRPETALLERHGVRCVRRSAWRALAEDRVSIALDVELQIGADPALERRYSVVLHPFSRAQLRRRLVAAGFERAAMDVIPGDDRYTALARTSLGSGPTGKHSPRVEHRPQAPR